MGIILRKVLVRIGIHHRIVWILNRELLAIGMAICVVTCATILSKVAGLVNDRYR